MEPSVTWKEFCQGAHLLHIACNVKTYQLNQQISKGQMYAINEQRELKNGCMHKTSQNYVQIAVVMFRICIINHILEMLASYD